MNDSNLFKTNIISLLDLEGASEEQKSKILKKATTIVQKKVLLRVLDQVSEETKEKLLNALDEGKQEEVQSILSENIDGLDNIIEEEVLDIKKELRDSVNSLDN